MLQGLFFSHSVSSIRNNPKFYFPFTTASLILPSQKSNIYVVLNMSLGWAYRWKDHQREWTIVGWIINLLIPGLLSINVDMILSRVHCVGWLLRIVPRGWHALEQSEERRARHCTWRVNRFSHSACLLMLASRFSTSESQDDNSTISAINQRGNLLINVKYFVVRLSTSSQSTH